MVLLLVPKMLSASFWRRDRLIAKRSRSCMVQMSSRRSTFVGLWQISLMIICMVSVGQTRRESRILALGYRNPSKHDPDQNHLERLVDFVCETLTGLRHLELTVQYEVLNPQNRTDEKQMGWVRELRAVLLTAACITKRHSVLKKAVLSAHSFGSRPRWLFGYMTVCFSVDLVAIGRSFHPLRRSTRYGIDGQKIETKVSTHRSNL